MAVHGFLRSAPQLALGIWECGAGLVTASHGEERAVLGLWRGRANFGGTGFDKREKNAISNLDLSAGLGTDQDQGLVRGLLF